MNDYAQAYEAGHDDGIAEGLAEGIEQVLQEVDRVVLWTFVGWLAGIFASDALFLKYRRSRNGAPVTYTGNTRNAHVRVRVRWRGRQATLRIPVLRLFFVYLMLHMWKRWSWDPLTKLTDYLEGK